MKRWGVIKNGKGEVIMHRTMLKMIFNPILRKFGCSIVSHIDTRNNKFIRYEVRSYPQNCRVIK